jgi:hypothetical protein
MLKHTQQTHQNMPPKKNAATDRTRDRTEENDKKDNEALADAIRRTILYVKLAYSDEFKDYKFGDIAKMVIGYCYDHGPVQFKGRDVNVSYRDICGMVVVHDRDLEDDARTGEHRYLQYYCAVYERNWTLAWQIENALLAVGVSCNRKVPQDKYETSNEMLVPYDEFSK